MVKIGQADDIPRLDEKKVHELKEILGEAVREIFDEFLNTAPASLDTIAASLLSGDSEKIFTEAHTLKSSSGNIGLARFCRLCTILEEQARNNQLVEAEAQLQLLNEELPAGVDALGRML